MNPPPLYRIRRLGWSSARPWTVSRWNAAWGCYMFVRDAFYPTHAQALADVVGRIDRSRA